LHTHRGATLGDDNGNGACLENIDGSNCTSCGDYICDTPADPYLLYAVDADCVYTLQSSSQFRPDTRNIMSYSSCKTRFSPQQLNVIFNKIDDASLRNINLPITTINSPTLCIKSKGSVSISNIRPNFYISNWVSSNTSVATINSNGTIYKISNGATTITATLTDGCQKYFVTKNIYIGTPSLIEGTYSYGTFTYPVSNPSTGIGVSGSTPIISINLNQTESNSNYLWNTVSSGGVNSFSPNGNNASIYLSGGAYLNISCKSQNECGFSPTIIFNCYNYSNFRIVASPNPLSQTLTVTSTLVDENSAKSTNEKLLRAC
jgi:hypothetical protein